MADIEQEVQESFEEVVARRRQGRTLGWYVIKTAPGAQQPQREYTVEQTPVSKLGKVRGKGYRITPSLNADISAIERSLSDAGFSYYMPAEKRLIRDRRHTDLWKVRRFALMVGYVFVRQPRDWRVLEATPGVAGIVANAAGLPLCVDILDILKIRSVEAASEVEFDQRARQARQQLRKKGKKDPRLQMLIDKLDIAGTISVPLNGDLLKAA